MHKFCFSSISSSEYISETEGLIENIKKFYPQKKILICAIDQKSYNFFSNNKKCNVFKAKSVWGEDCWKNLKCRMSTAEIAYATKSAFSYFILKKKFYKSTMMLDSDLLILHKIDDLIKFTIQFPVMLMSARHNLEDWRRTNEIGLFSAGIMGFSQRSLSGLKWWMIQCFDNTNINIFNGNYYEQKYLDYFIMNFETKIIRDLGINVSSTILDKTKPFFCKKKKTWFTSDKKLIRVFHQSRTTNHEIYELKKKFITSQKNDKKKIKKKKIFNIEKILRIIVKRLAICINLIIILKRIKSTDESFIVGLKEYFLKKKEILKKMDIDK